MIRSILSVLFALLFAAPGLALTLKPGTAWPSATIPVCWESPKRRHAQERDMIRKALARTWERESAVRFTGWRACTPDSPGVRIAFDARMPQARGRGTEVDGMPRGVILPALWSVSALSVNIKAPVHEFGHALGFGHEYARPDAPELDRCGVKDAAGRPYLEPDTPLTPYDPDSIMVACVAEATARYSRGAPALSAADIHGLVQVYGSHPDNVLDADETGDAFGARLTVEDLDGDGAPDLAVGAPGEDDGAGAVYLYRNAGISGLRPWRRLEAGDLAAGPFAHLAHLIAPPGKDEVRLDGVARRYADLGLDKVFSANAHHFPMVPGAEMGAWMAMVDVDLNADGLPDRIIGAAEADGAAPRSGLVIVLRGQPDGGLRPWYWFGQAN